MYDLDDGLRRLAANLGIEPADRVKHGGREEQALDFARKAIQTFERVGVDAVVGNAAGGSNIKEYAHQLQMSTSGLTRAEALAASRGALLRVIPGGEIRGLHKAEICYGDASSPAAGARKGTGRAQGRRGAEEGTHNVRVLRRSRPRRPGEAVEREGVAVTTTKFGTPLIDSIEPVFPEIRCCRNSDFPGYPIIEHPSRGGITQ